MDPDIENNAAEMIDVVFSNVDWYFFEQRWDQRIVDDWKDDFLEIWLIQIGLKENITKQGLSVSNAKGLPSSG